LNKDAILNLIYTVFDDVNQQLPPNAQLEKSPQTLLMGDSTVLDSLGLINLIVGIEEKLEDIQGNSLSLTDEFEKEAVL
jgi:acyl carrier protein